MKIIRPTLTYVLQGFKALTVIAFLSILGNLAITNLIYHWTAPDPAPRVVLTAPLDNTAAVFAFLIGLILVLINWKVALANGVSRKTFLLANLPAAALVAAALALFIVLVIVIHSQFWPVVTTLQLFYPWISLPALVLLQFALYLLLVIAGWFVCFAYYRASVAGRWAISIAPVLLFVAYRLINALTLGALGDAIRAFWRATMRGAPLTATLTLLVYAALLYGAVYLLIRRAPLR